MATFLVRFNAIVDHLKDPVVISNPARTAVADAYLAQATDAHLRALFPGLAPVDPFAPFPRASLTNEQRAEVVVTRWLNDARTVVKQVRRDADQAAADALVAAGQVEAGTTL